MTAFQRKLDILQFVPAAPRKVSSRQIFENLQNCGHDNIDMRTIQRDLVNLEKVGLFGLEVDKRSKPYGWFINASFKKLNLSLMDGNTALAFKVLEQSGATLPNSTVKELQPYFIKAGQILEQNNDSLLTHWLKTVTDAHVSQPLLSPEIDAASFERLKNAIFFKKQISADIKRIFNGGNKVVWKHYDRVNPMGLIKQGGRQLFVCTFGSLHKRRYALPLQFIKNVTVTDNECQQRYENIEDAQLIPLYQKQEITLTLLVKNNALFLLHGYKLAEDQTICQSSHPDKSVLTATVSDTNKLRAFLRGLGDNIEVIEPPKLRAYFCDLSERLYMAYKTAH
ncbi:WYL domain-containing protein [Alteromonas sp. 345S023]|uniref:WYL domain-containing protein n=1 Tax=Alteromonas profundi TaxID=2696062 RepID=A0A7X5RJI1_9ALTE|nr:WYL domain-containing protein [Alteromonas profundi]NDV89898.1 WYL domain-containing protein [Alteromonas profundi]